MKILVHHHLGLGDHFVCNGLVRCILAATNADRLYLPSYIHNFHTVTQMYSDEPRIVVLGVTSDAAVYQLPEVKSLEGLYRVGFENTREDWDVSFYDQLGLPFSYRYQFFYVNRDTSREKLLADYLGIRKGMSYILVHNTGSTGKINLRLASNDKQVIHVEPITNSILDWLWICENAEAVHCIDSSFIHLAQSVGVKSGFFHKARSCFGHFQLRETWNEVDYL